ncbi:MAG: EAL domain-containing protein [Acidobacteriota bacterium]
MRLIRPSPACGRGWRGAPGEGVSIIPVASAVTNWVLDRACAQMVEWQSRGMGEISVNVNLSPVQLRQYDIIERIDTIVRRHAVDPRRVRLEVTESAIVATPDATAYILRQIAGLGIQLCIDDFGIGYSSLAQLLRMPFTSLKIDRSLISEIAECPEQREMVRAITSLARTRSTCKWWPRASSAPSSSTC